MDYSGGMYSAGQSFSKPQTTIVPKWRMAPLFFGPVSRQFRAFSKKGGEQDQLYNQWKTDYMGNSENALANSKIYEDYTKNLFANSPNQMADYQATGNYLFDKFDQFRDTSAASGMRDMNSQLARLGIRPGSTGYDRLINANRITNNLAPAFMNTTNAIGRDYNAINANSMNDIMLRLGLASDDALTGYQDRAIARPLDVIDERSREINNITTQYRNLSEAYNQNIAGYQTKETSDLAKAGGVFDNFMNSYAGSQGYGDGQGSSNTGGFQASGAGGNQLSTQNNPWSSAGAMNNFNPDGSSIGGSGDPGGELGGGGASSGYGGGGGGGGSGYSGYGGY